MEATGNHNIVLGIVILSTLVFCSKKRKRKICSTFFFTLLSEFRQKKTPIFVFNAPILFILSLSPSLPIYLSLSLTLTSRKNGVLLSMCERWCALQLMFFALPWVVKNKSLLFGLGDVNTWANWTQLRILKHTAHTESHGAY